MTGSPHSGHFAPTAIPAVVAATVHTAPGGFLPRAPPVHRSPGISRTSDSRVGTRAPTSAGQWTRSGTRTGADRHEQRSGRGGRNRRWPMRDREVHARPLLRGDLPPVGVARERQRDARLRRSEKGLGVVAQQDRGCIGSDDPRVGRALDGLVQSTPATTSGSRDSAGRRAVGVEEPRRSSSRSRPPSGPSPHRSPSSSRSWFPITMNAPSGASSPTIASKSGSAPSQERSTMSPVNATSRDVRPRAARRPRGRARPA